MIMNKDKNGNSLGFLETLISNERDVGGRTRERVTAGIRNARANGKTVWSPEKRSRPRMNSAINSSR